MCHRRYTADFLAVSDRSLRHCLCSITAMRLITQLSLGIVLIVATGCDSGSTLTINVIETPTTLPGTIQTSPSPSATPSPSPISSPSPTPSPSPSASISATASVYSQCAAYGGQVTTVSSAGSNISVCKYQAAQGQFDISASVMSIAANGTSVSGGTATSLQVDAGDALQVLSFGHYSPSGGVCDANNGGGDISVLGNSNGKYPTVNSANGSNVSLWLAFENSDGQYTSPVNSTVQYSGSSSQAAQTINVPVGYPTNTLVLGYNSAGAIGCGDMGVYYSVTRCIDANGNTYACSGGTPPTWNIGNSGTDSTQTIPFSVTGQGGTSPTFSTDSNGGSYLTTNNFLQVTVAAGAGGNFTFPSTTTNQYSSFSDTYNCVSYTVSVYDKTNALLASRTTQTLAVTAGNSGCPGSPTSQTLDLSDVITSGNHDGLTLSVQANSYDFYCQYWYSLYYAFGTASPWYADYSSFCPMKQVYQTHTVNGSLGVVTN
jgi:putative hemolysin